MADEKVQVEISAVDRASQVFTNLGRHSDDLVQSLTAVFTPARLLGGLIGFELVSALKSAVDGFTKFALQVRDLAFLSGGSARDVSILITGLEDLGVESSTVERALSIMSRAITEGSPAFVRLENATGRNVLAEADLVKAFYATIDSLAGMTDATTRNAISREIWGRGWTQMVPVLAMGSAKLRELGEENAKSGKVMSEAGVKAAFEYQQALKALDHVIEGLKIQVGAEMVPSLTELFRVMGPVAIDTGRIFLGIFQEIDSALLLAGASLAAFVKPFAFLTDLVGLSRGAFEQWSTARDVAYGASLDLASKGVANLTLQQRALADSTQKSADATKEQGDASTRAAARAAQLKRDLVSAQIAQVQAAAAVAQAAALPEGIPRLEAELTAGAELISTNLQKEVAEIAIAEDKGGLHRDEARRRRDAAETAASAGMVKLWSSTEDQIRKENIRLYQLEVKDRERLLDEESILGDQANAEALSGLAEYDRERARVERDDFARLAADLRAANFAFDDTIREHQTATYQATEAEIAEARARGAREQRERMVRDFREEEQLRRQKVEDEKALLIARLQGSDDYFTKVRLGLQLHVTDWRTADERILDVTREFASAATRSLDDLFFNVLHGRFKSLTDIAKQFGEQVLRIASQELARSTLSGLFGASGVLGPAGGGGTSPAGTALGAAQLAALTSGGPAGASSGGGGGLLSPITSLITGATKLPGAITALIEGGPMAALDKLVGLTPLLKALGLGAPNLTSEIPELAVPVAPSVPIASGGAASLFPTGMGIGEEAAGITGATTPAFAAALPVAALALPISMAIGSILSNRAESKLAAQQNNAIGQWLQQNPAALAQALQNLQADVASSPQADVLGRPHQAPRLTIPLVPGMDSNLVFRAMADMFKDRRGIAPGWDALLEYLPKHRLAMTPAGGIMYLGEPNFPGETSADVESLAYQPIARQQGGPISPGQAYWVGERGPELVIPRQAATVVPTEQARAAGGNVYITIEQRAPIMGFEGAREFARFMVAEIRRLGIAMPGVDLFPVR